LTTNSTIILHTSFVGAFLVPVAQGLKNTIYSRRRYEIPDARIFGPARGRIFRILQPPFCRGRFGETTLPDLAELRWNNIDLLNGEIQLVTSKTGRRVSLPLVPRLRRHIESLPSSDDGEAPIHPRAFQIVQAQSRSGSLSTQFGALLCDAGLRKSKSHVSRGIGRATRRTVNDLSFHSLRRTATTLLHEAGVPQAVAQAFIGHDSAAMHEIYVAVGWPALEDAAGKMPDVMAGGEALPLGALTRPEISA
jgi:integrase